MGSKIKSAARSVLGSVGNMYGVKSASEVKKEANSASEAAQAATQAELDAANAAAAETEAQQDAVQKKMAALGRLQAGYTFSDSNTASTKVFS